MRVSASDAKAIAVGTANALHPAQRPWSAGTPALATAGTDECGSLQQLIYHGNCGPGQRMWSVQLKSPDGARVVILVDGPNGSSWEAGGSYAAS